MNATFYSKFTEFGAIIQKTFPLNLKIQNWQILMNKFQI